MKKVLAVLLLVALVLLGACRDGNKPKVVGAWYSDCSYTLLLHENGTYDGDGIFSSGRWTQEGDKILLNGAWDGENALVVKVENNKRVLVYEGGTYIDFFTYYSDKATADKKIAEREAEIINELSKDIVGYWISCGSTVEGPIEFRSSGECYYFIDDVLIKGIYTVDAAGGGQINVIGPDGKEVISASRNGAEIFDGTMNYKKVEKLDLTLNLLGRWERYGSFTTKDVFTFTANTVTQSILDKETTWTYETGVDMLYRITGDGDRQGERIYLFKDADGEMELLVYEMRESGISQLWTRYKKTE